MVSEGGKGLFIDRIVHRRQHHAAGARIQPVTQPHAGVNALEPRLHGVRTHAVRIRQRGQPLRL